MLFSLVATVLALVWLLHRATRLLQVPIPTLVQLLGIDVPSPPLVCLDTVGADSIVLHWSLPERANSVAKHVIQMNGQNAVGESEKRETTVTVTGLTPDHIYSVRVLAVNSKNYSASGQLIRLRTRRQSEDLVLASVQPVRRSSVDAAAAPAPAADAAAPAKPDGVQTQFRRGKDSRRPSEHSSFTAATQPYTLESLTAELDQIRSEIIETSQQLSHGEDEHAVAEAALLAELAVLRGRRREEDSVRAQLRTETKALEESKRALEAQKAKVERALKQRRDDIDRAANQRLRWRSEAADARLRAARLAEESARCSAEAAERVRQLRDEAAAAAAEAAEAEEVVRTLVANIKRAESRRDTRAAGTAANPALRDDPEFMARLQAENDEDMRLQKAWQDTQKALEMRYVKVFQTYRDAEEEYRRAQELLVNPQARQMAQDKKAAQLGRRRSRMRKAGPVVSGPLASYPLHDPRFPDAATFNDLAFGNLRTSASMTSLITSASRAALAASAAPPSAGSGLQLAPFMSAPVAPGPEITLFDDADGGPDGPVSPSVDMLLPTNLFVSDDMPR
ncbi:uncharacterized protein V1510DRAFT_348116, partial [Dipodascopsis tothii]|uniref:uncharacterized protein n=1 Tax=Dipodascopsis tothii TaxID=44089 RepID=UPI0034CDBDAA